MSTSCNWEPEIDGALSSKKILQFGPPTGSVLGHVLFSLYTTPLVDINRKHGVSFHTYTYDKQNY